MSGRDGQDAISIAVPHEVDTLDPHAKNTLANFAIAFNLYEALVTTDAEMRIRPSLARYWENVYALLLAAPQRQLHPGRGGHAAGEVS